MTFSRIRWSLLETATEADHQLSELKKQQQKTKRKKTTTTENKDNLHYVIEPTAPNNQD